MSKMEILYEGLLCLLLFGVYAHATCSSSIQTCRNCHFADPPDSCSFENVDGLDDVSCAALVSRTEPATVYNTNSSGTCIQYSCKPEIKYSPHWTMTYRTHESGCRIITLGVTRNTKVSETPTYMKDVDSEAECISKCIDSASRMNRSCTASFAASIQTCSIYTSCASSSCQVESGNSDWSVFVALCSHSECIRLQNPQNGVVITTGARAGDTDHYECHEGFHSPLSNPRTCLDSGSWTATDPTCDPVDCGNVNSTAHGLLSISKTTYLSNVSYSCDAGYNLIGNANRTCQANASWSGSIPACEPVDCGRPSNLSNGMVSITGTTYLHASKYNCSYGYILSGVSQRTCQANASWSGSDPGCEPAACGHPSNLSNGMVSIIGTTFKQVATYNCSDGYILSGFSQRTCLGNASWSGSDPECEPVYCGNSPYIENGFATIKNTSLPVTANYTCATGYVINGVNFSVCLSDGNWSSAIPVCEPIDCGMFDSPPNGSVLFNGTSFLHVAEYECNYGYKLSIQNSTGVRVCQADGSWNGTEAECIPVECPVLGIFTRGSVNMPRGRQYGQMAIYTCEAGYILNGNRERKCLQYGNWSGGEPTCETTNGSVISNGTHTKPGRIYIMPCLCNSNKTFTNMSIAQIIDQLVTDTKIDRKNTSAALNRLRSKHDKRKSSKIIGFLGVFVLSVVLALLLFSDAVTFLNLRKIKIRSLDFGETEN